MDTKIDKGTAGYAIQPNTIIQASTRTAYHISGGQVTPGTSSTGITVAVDTGDARINDTAVSWSAEELQLADGGVGPSGTDTGNPRVDVVYAKQNGTLGVAVGEPEPFAPDTDADGNPITPAPFQHWNPSPNDGSNVGGVPLAFVLVEPDDGTAADISGGANGDIMQWKIGAAEGSQFVKGDGTDTGPTTIEVNGNPFTIEDGTDEWFDYDPGAGTLGLGAPGINPTLGADMRANGNNITGIGSLVFDDSNSPKPIRYDSANGAFQIQDDSTPEGSPPDTPLTIGAGSIYARRGVNTQGADLQAGGGDVAGVENVKFGRGFRLFVDSNGNLLYIDEANNATTITGAP